MSVSYHDEYWLNPPEPKEICECSYCGGSLYAYDEAREIETGEYIHDDCLMEWAREMYPLVELEPVRR